MDINFKMLEYPRASNESRAMNNTYGKHAERAHMKEWRLISDVKDYIDNITHCQLATNISPRGVGIEAVETEKQLHTE